jgi:UDP:flavonoid glycosyltransferase YjiC (YdhE family)
MRVLIIPSFLGGGFGHIGRCQVLAEEMKASRHEVFFAMGGPHITRIREAGFSVYELKAMPVARSARTKPAFLFVSSLAYQIVRDGFDSTRKIRKAMQEAVKVARLCQPDLIVSDSWPPARLVAKALGLPLIQIVKAVTHPQGTPLVWWEPLPADLREPNVLPLFNPLMKWYGLPELTRVEELSLGDLMLIPSIPELDPLQSGSPATQYVGAMTLSPPAEDVPEWMSRLKSDCPVVYISVGGAASSAGGCEFF